MHVTFEPIEIWVHCDVDGCDAHALVWRGDPDQYQGTQLPDGWTQHNDVDQTYCPDHSEYETCLI